METAVVDALQISIHSLRMEGDYVRIPAPAVGWYFNPLPPHGGRRIPGRGRSLLRNFNPLPPHGGRLNSPWRLASHESFQSTPSAWRETQQNHLRHEYTSGISIHSLRMEGDGRSVFQALRQLDFNPLPPHGGRRPSIDCSVWRSLISIHSLRMEGD